MLYFENSSSEIFEGKIGSDFSFFSSFYDIFNRHGHIVPLRTGSTNDCSEPLGVQSADRQNTRSGYSHCSAKYPLDSLAALYSVNSHPTDATPLAKARSFVKLWAR